MTLPRGALPENKGKASGDRGVTTGRLYGPSLFPRGLETVYSAAKLGLPIIGAGGVWTKENAEAMLSAGALAVQVDAVLWGVNWLSQSAMV